MLSNFAKLPVYFVCNVPCTSLTLDADSFLHLMRGRRVFPQRSPEDGIIDWSLPALQIFNFIRAQTKPYPGAFTSYGQDKVTIWTIRLAGDAISQSLSPAEIKEVNQVRACRSAEDKYLPKKQLTVRLYTRKITLSLEIFDASTRLRNCQ